MNAKVEYFDLICELRRERWHLLALLFETDVIVAAFGLPNPR
jgi:hypothetical protein